MKKNKTTKKDNSKKDNSKKDKLIYNTRAGFFKTLYNWYIEFVNNAQKNRPKKLSKFFGVFYALLIGWGGWHKIYEGDFLMGITYGSITLIGCSIMIFLKIRINFLGNFTFFLPAMAVEVIAIFDAFAILIGKNKKYK